MGSELVVVPSLPLVNPELFKSHYYTHHRTKSEETMAPSAKNTVTKKGALVAARLGEPGTPLSRRNSGRRSSSEVESGETIKVAPK